MQLGDLTVDVVPGNPHVGRPARGQRAYYVLRRRALKLHVGPRAQVGVDIGRVREVDEVVLTAAHVAPAVLTDRFALLELHHAIGQRRWFDRVDGDAGRRACMRFDEVRIGLQSLQAMIACDGKTLGADDEPVVNVAAV